MGRNIKTRIRPVHAIACVYKDSLPEGDIKEIIDNLEINVTRAAEIKGFQEPNPNAFSNTRGYWFEIIIAVLSWVYRLLGKNEGILVVKLPNIRVFNFKDIFIPETRNLLNQLESSLLRQEEQVRLVTSNPDLLFIQAKNLLDDDSVFLTPITNLSADNIVTILNAYLYLSGKCSYQSIRAGLGLKTSLRPDRRLQLVHEGNILKSIFYHLKLRYWDRDYLFYYFGAANAEIGAADDDALQTAATHTIIDVNSVPERAVDKIYSLINTSDISETMLPEIINKIGG